MTHDYTGCQDPACEGYSAGKAKALFECAIATCHMSATPECTGDDHQQSFAGGCIRADFRVRRLSANAPLQV